MTFIAIGIASLLAVVTLRQDAAGADAGSLVTAGQSLVAIHDWTFLLGPGWVVGVGNGLILGWLMYRSGLVPRGMAMLGLVAGPVLLAGGTAALLGVIEPDSALTTLAAAPEFVWELSLGIYLTVKGFKPAGIERLQADRRRAVPAAHPVPTPSRWLPTWRAVPAALQVLCMLVGSAAGTITTAVATGKDRA